MATPPEIRFENKPGSHQFVHIFYPDGRYPNLSAVGIYHDSKTLPVADPGGRLWIGEGDEAWDVFLPYYAKHYVDVVWTPVRLQAVDHTSKQEVAVTSDFREAFPKYFYRLYPVVAYFVDVGVGPHSVSHWSSMAAWSDNVRSDVIGGYGQSPEEAERSLWHGLRIHERVVRERLYPRHLQRER